MFGPLTDARNRWLLEGVVAGIGGYGNCIGVPTVGGEIRFAEPHSANPSVDVMCVGLAKADELVTSTSLEAHAGSLMVLYGATTGRDGIGGVSVLASATLDDSSQDARPSVQIGDPFAEKLLIEASLELIHQGLLEGLQDLGGAGITCAVSESAARADMGAVLDLDAVPLARAGHGGVRDPHQRIAGTHARDRAPVQARGRHRGVRAMGPAHGRDRRTRRGRHPHRDARGRGRRRDAGHLADRRRSRVRPAAGSPCDHRSRTIPRSRRSKATCARRSSPW